MTTPRASQLDAAVDAGLDRAIDDLKRLCRQPSVSAQNLGMAEAAGLVATMLGEHGFAARIIPVAGGYPVVYAEAPGQSERTLLFYNHYDVQPPEPLELWDSPPFEPALRDGTLYARGVSDDKGHIASRLAALAAVRAIHGAFPCRVKFLIEGEEEIGSPRLPAFIATHRDLLRADACVWESGGVGSDERRAELSFGCRGICYVQLSVRTLAQDAHSGQGGSVLPNAAWRLAWALAMIKGPDERILIPGFYDAVRPPSGRDLALLAAAPDPAASFRQRFGIERFLRDLAGDDLKRESVFTPTATICGLSAGYEGPGMKTVLPALASAKLDFRLVPNQDPEDVYAKLRRYLDAAGFADVQSELIAAEHPARVDPDHPFARLVAQTAAEVYGQPPVIRPLVGGTGPMYPFVELLGLPIGTPGISYPGASIHAPNENIRLANFVLGTKHMARVLDRFVES